MNLKLISCVNYSNQNIALYLEIFTIIQSHENITYCLVPLPKTFFFLPHLGSRYISDFLLSFFFLLPFHGFIMERNLCEEDDSDVDIMLLMVVGSVDAYESQIPRPMRRQITKKGHAYIQKALKDDPIHFRQLHRMNPEVFAELCHLLQMKTDLKGTPHVCVEEMVATFLMTMGQNSRYCHTMNTFKISKFSTSINFHKVLRALNMLAPTLLAKVTNTVPSKISKSTRFYPYFKDCVGAIDGTHINAMVQGPEKASYRNRKGVISQNVLAACNFDLEFIYVLSGWEGSAHDSKVLQDALTRRTNRLQVPEGNRLQVPEGDLSYDNLFLIVCFHVSEKYYLADCGFPNRRNFLAPLRSTRYHLQDFRGEGRDPTNHNELFNLRHASLRNVVERIFGIFKSRFLIFKSAPPFSFKTQAEIVLACAALHNFLRQKCRSDEFSSDEEDETDVDNANQNSEENGGEENVETQEQEREHARHWRATIAADMWRDATNIGSQR
ncbi:putative harbinger transposase-derived nuclease domain-containing protein [Arabidopsis thaliana]